MAGKGKGSNPAVASEESIHSGQERAKTSTKKINKTWRLGGICRGDSMMVVNLF
jgi:hypothetical protein